MVLLRAKIYFLLFFLISPPISPSCRHYEPEAGGRKRENTIAFSEKEKWDALSRTVLRYRDVRFQPS